MITDSTQQAIAMVLAGAGRALADCAGEAQPKRWLLHLPLKRVNRNDLRAGAQNEGEPALTRYSLISVKCSRETAYASFFPRPIHIQTLPTRISTKRVPLIRLLPAAWSFSQHYVGGTSLFQRNVMKPLSPTPLHTQ
jgi:hypothetical protein